MGIFSDIGVALCGASDCVGDGEGGCGEYVLLNPSSCINHVAVISVDAILLFMFLWSSLWRLSNGGFRLGGSPMAISPLRLASALWNAGLGLGYLVLGLYVLGSELRRSKGVLPLHLWALPVLHGFTWVLTCTIMSSRTSLAGRVFLRVWLGIAVALATFLCSSAILGFTFLKVTSPKGILDMLSFPGAVILTICTLKTSMRDGIDGFNDDPLLVPLNKEPLDIIEVESSDYVTPYVTAGFLSQLSFWWLNPLMKRGYQKPLEQEDIPQLCNVDRAESCYNLFVEKLNRQMQPPPSIFRTIVDCYWRNILVSGFFALCKILTLSSGPVLLKSFIELVEQEERSAMESFLLALALFAAKFFESIAQRQWYFRSRTLGLQIRSLLSAAIYRKQLRLSNASKIVHSSGEIMNYVTVDAYRIGEFPFYMHQLWTTVLQLCIALLILYNIMGLATFASFAVIVLTVACNTPLAKLQHKFQTKLMQAQDERLKAVTEALVNMKVLKLYAWETHFKEAIEELRKVEIKWLSAFQMRRAYNSLLFWSSPVIVSIATFLACYFLGIPLDASRVFTFVATLRLVQDPVRTIPDVIGVVIQANVAFERIVRFLDAPELQNTYMRKKHIDGVGYPISINCASFSWEPNLQRPTLRNVTLHIRHKDKVAICGEVGSGKSTLLAAILGEISNTAGTIQVSGRVAYVSQTAWIPTGTIQENILFGSAMDKQRYRQTLEKCSLVKDLEVLPFGDLTEIGERGVNLSGGQKQRLQLARALYQDSDIYLLDDPFSAVDAHTATSLFNDYVMDALSEKIVLLVTHQVDFLPAFDSILLISDGEILHAAPFAELMASSGDFQKLVHAHKETVSSGKLHKDVLHQNSELSGKKVKRIADGDTNISKAIGDQLIRKEERETGNTGFKPYLLYLRQNRGYLYLSIAALSHMMFIAGQISQNSWMAANVQNPRVSQLRLIMVYLAIGCSTTIVLAFRSLFVVALGIETSKSLFSQLLSSLFRAPMTFFDSTPIGRILSRVSADLSIVDLDVPFSIIFSTAATLNAMSNLGVLAAITWQIMLVSTPMIYLTIKLQRYYLASAKELMRINGTTKSLMANHLAESVAGAVTIRAFNEEERFFAKNLQLIDGNASPFFHNFAATEWLIQRLETMCAIILSTSALFMAFLPRGTWTPGFIGMSLSYGLSLNMSLVFSIQNQCILTSYIISVERLNQYMAIPGEAPEILEDNRPGHSWPTVGKVEFQDLKIRYRPDTPLVLHGISCIFEGCYKVGIVGRTGSGKTTLIGALFRLVEPAGGRILIDGLDIATIGLHDLRSRLAIIPQDPTLFNGTIRYNLDPLGKHTDADIWEVLEKCQLNEAVKEKQLGLDSLVIEDGSNWSLGQRQLFCLCRALLRKSRIIVLDEATASIDNATDAILQKTIRSEFARSTVITVAHRIPTVMDCTMVLAISDGRLVEFDEPQKLMKSEKSLFALLVKEYWSHGVNSEFQSTFS